MISSLEPSPKIRPLVMESGYRQMLVGKPIEVHLAPVGQPPKKHVRAQYLLPEPES